MGFHQFDTTFTLDPRVDIPKQENVSRGLGNQVTVEFNLLYRFHCAISLNDEKYLESFMVETMKEVAERAATKQGGASQPSSKSSGGVPDPKSLSMMQFAGLAAELSKESKKDPWLQEFGLKNSETQTFKRNTITGLFDDEKMIEQLRKSMNDPICKSLSSINGRVSKCYRGSTIWTQKCAEGAQKRGNYGYPASKKMVRIQSRKEHEGKS